MVEAAWWALCFEFVDGRRNGCYSAVAKCFVETPEQLRQLSLYGGSNRQQQLILKVSKFSLQMSQKYGDDGTDVINHVDLERSTTPEQFSCCTVKQLVEQAEIRFDLRRANLPPGFRLELAGSADRLSETGTASVSICIFCCNYLSVVSAYRSFYPLVLWQRCQSE